MRSNGAPSIYSSVAVSYSEFWTNQPPVGSCGRTPAGVTLEGDLTEVYIFFPLPRCAACCNVCSFVCVRVCVFPSPNLFGTPTYCSLCCYGGISRAAGVANPGGRSKKNLIFLADKIIGDGICFPCTRYDTTCHRK